MDQKTLIPKTIILFLAITSLLAITLAQSSSCRNVLISLSPCIDYISGNSSSPSSGCCKQLATVVQSQPQCLCQVLNGSSSSLGISINQTQAMNLPTACNVQTPSISSCSSGSSSNSIPTSTDGSSDGSATKLSLSFIVSLLFVASYSSAIISV
ncbi:hypothetical protein V2J09_014224 [Rumex salicifolius]